VNDFTDIVNAPLLGGHYLTQFYSKDGLIKKEVKKHEVRYQVEKVTKGYIQV